MSASLSDKVYIALNAEERFRAALSAAARRDMVELDRLIETCPNKTYRMRDADFISPLRGFAHIANDQKAYLTHLCLTASVALMLALKHEYADEPDQSSDYLRATALVEMTRSAIAGARLAWSDFCAERGVPEEEMQVFSGVGEDDVLSFVFDILEDTPIVPDETMRQRRLSQLRASWDVRN